MAAGDALQLGNANVDLMGTSLEFLECDATKYPNGLHVHFTAPGQLAPVRTGFMSPGSAVLYMQPEAAQQFKGAVSQGPKVRG